MGKLKTNRLRDRWPSRPFVHPEDITALDLEGIPERMVRTRRPEPDLPTDHKVWVTATAPGLGGATDYWGVETLDSRLRTPLEQEPSSSRQRSMAAAVSASLPSATRRATTSA